MPTYIAVYKRLPHAWHNGSWERQTTIEANSQEQAEQEAQRRCGQHEELVAVRTTAPAQAAG